jgi:hypothetical protein
MSVGTRHTTYSTKPVFNNTLLDLTQCVEQGVFSRGLVKSYCHSVNVGSRHTTYLTKPVFNNTLLDLTQCVEQGVFSRGLVKSYYHSVNVAYSLT